MLNQKDMGPLRHRLSEPPQSPAPTDRWPGRDAGAPARENPLPGDHIARRAAELLGNLPRPEELSPAAQVRIRDRLAAADTKAPRWPWAVAATALGAAATAVFLLPRLSGGLFQSGDELLVRELRLPESGVARLRTAPGSEWFLVGPGSLSLPAEAAPRVAQLKEGRLAVRADRSDVVVDAGSRRVTIPKGHLAEVVVHLGELVRVAAYVGDSRLGAGEHPLLVRAGTAWTREGERPLSAACRGLFIAALAGEPWPSAADCGDNPVELRAAAPVVTALPAEAGSAAARPADEPTAGARPTVRPAVRAARPSAGAVPVLAAGAPAAAPLGTGAAVADATESGLAAESRLLGVALHQLRQERDGNAALRSLELYQQRFPGGLLVEEAQAARLDALLLLDHRSEALKLLDQMQFQRLGRGGELRVVRAELRASAGRCREALGDFSAVLAATAAPPPPPVAERALYGRASCLAALSDSPGARAGLEQYLSQFPSGRFADAARRSLQNLP